MTAAKVSCCTQGIFIDNGSSLTKAGTKDQYPRCVFPTCVGVSNADETSEGLEHYFGDYALSRKDKLQIKYPIERGIIKDWDLMEKFWENTFNNELQKSSEQMWVMLTESIFNNLNNREKTTQIMFESFCVSNFYLVNTPRLVLRQNGFSTGVSVEFGAGIASVVPFYEGHPIKFAAHAFPLAGEDLTSYLYKLLREQGKNVSEQDAEEIKKQKCYVAENVEAELTKNKTQSYTCLNGEKITLGNELFMCPEAIFQPSLLGLEVPGIAEAVYNSIMKCDYDLREYLFTNICLGGGASLFPNFKTRLQREVEALVRVNTIVTVHGGISDMYCVWEGDSHFFENPDSGSWIYCEEYDENGPSIIHRRCY